MLEALTDLVARHGLDRAPFDALIEAHIGRVHGEPHDLEAFYVEPMRTAVRILTGPGHEAAAADAGRVWGLSQTGSESEARALRARANSALKALPAVAFPAVAHAALIRPGAPEFLKRLRLLAAVASGRI